MKMKNKNKHWESLEDLMRDFRCWLSEYYFDNPLPEDETDDVDLLKTRADERVRVLSDDEVLRKVLKIWTNK